MSCTGSSDHKRSNIVQERNQQIQSRLGGGRLITVHWVILYSTTWPAASGSRSKKGERGSHCSLDIGMHGIAPIQLAKRQ